MTEEEKKMNEDFQKLKFIGFETEEEITLDDGRVVSQITVEEFKDHPRTLFFRPITNESEG